MEESLEATLQYNDNRRVVIRIPETKVEEEPDFLVYDRTLFELNTPSIDRGDGEIELPTYREVDDVLFVEKKDETKANPHV